MEEENLDVNQLEMIFGGIIMCGEHPAFERSMIGVSKVIEKESPDLHKEMEGFFYKLLSEGAENYPLDLSRFNFRDKAKAGAGICFLLSAIDMCAQGAAMLHAGAEQLKKMQKEFVEDNQ